MKLGTVKFDTVEYASRANAVIGIRDSGKSYTATGLAEQLLDSTAAPAGIPFIALDPAGIWRFLRVPGTGKGYPVVVVGQHGADLPLKSQTIGKIVEAALRGRVSLVIDMSGDISKADMRRIVTEVVTVLMQKNKQYGLRHVFIEESAEFVPQRINDPVVYSAVEKLVRIGGNMGLGVTLVNPRTENLNKEVLELCDNIFLHRQKGKNSLKNLAGWFEASGHDAPKEMTTTISSLGSGECFVWLRDGDGPVRVKVQTKNSHHPNRRELGAPTAKSGKTVDASAFVAALKESLPQIEEEIKSNDPAALKKEIVALKAELAKKPTVIADPSGEALKQERASGFNEAWPEGHSVGWKDGYTRGFRDAIEGVASGLKIMGPPAEPPSPEMDPKRSFIRDVPARMPVRYSTPPVRPKQPRDVTTTVVRVNGTALTKAQQKVLDGIAWWNDVGDKAPSRVKLCAITGLSPTASTMGVYLAKLKQDGYIEYNNGGVVLTLTGEQATDDREVACKSDLRERIREIMSPAEAKVWDIIAEAHPAEISKELLCERGGYSPDASTIGVYLAALRRYEFVERRGIKAQDWLFQ